MLSVWLFDGEVLLIWRMLMHPLWGAEKHGWKIQVASAEDAAVMIETDHLKGETKGQDGPGG